MLQPVAETCILGIRRTVFLGTEAKNVLTLQQTHKQNRVNTKAPWELMINTFQDVGCVVGLVFSICILN